MWYEILPSMAILSVVVTIPPVFNYVFQKLIQKGNPYRRDIYSSAFNLKNFQRDKVLTGNPYIQKGLESIPDN
uniref:Unkown protein n=1 Tax=Riptortus pedestris TaxID=329032 RepID=R4WCU9_RIPPE|nr:unkown protein [Riptortus pedestris]